MAQFGVDIVLNGHDHDYQRWKPLNGSGQRSSKGITEFVVGTAGHGLQEFTRSDSRVAYSNNQNPSAFGILLLQLNKTGAGFSYRSTNGTVLDSGAISCVPPTADATAPGAPGVCQRRKLELRELSLNRNGKAVIAASGGPVKRES